MLRILRYAGRVIASLMIATVLGICSVFWALEDSSAPVRNGAWNYNPLVGSAADGLYSRARAAYAGPLALNQSEALYFTASTDDSGKPLEGDHDYRIEGRSLDARWWSVTAYGADGFLIPNDVGRYSYNSENISHKAGGGFTLHLSRAKKPGDWIPTGKAETFTLALRLYNPAPSARAHPAGVALPKIIAEASHE